METEEELRKSMAKFRKSIYGGDDIGFEEIFQFDMDEEDHKQILSVMGGSLSRLPSNFKSEVMSKFLNKHPELKGHIHEDDENISEDYSTYTLRTLRWTEFHQEFVRDLQSLTSTFSIFDPEKLSELMLQKQRPHYDLARVYSIQKVANDINNSLYILYKLNRECRMKDIKLSDYEHFYVFSWTEDRFIARRQMKGTAWIDIFRKSLNDECLDTFKFQFDVVELARLLKPLLLSFYAESKEFIEDAVRIINDASNLVNMHNEIQLQLESGIALFCQRINLITNISLQRRSDGRDVAKNFLEMQTMATCVRDPIENRYRINYTNERVEEWKDYYDFKERQLKTDLKKCKRKYDVELYCFQNMMQSMYGTIQDYKRRIATMTVEYDRHLTEANERNTMMKVSIEKIKIQRDHLEAEKVYMKSRIQEISNVGSSSNVKKRKPATRKFSQMSLIRKVSSSILPQSKKQRVSI